MALEERDLFKKFEAKREYLKTKKTRAELERRLGPHRVLLKKGAVPDYVKLTPYQEFCWKTIGSLVKSRKPSEDLEENLLKAHWRMRPEEYMAYTWMTTILVLIGSIIAALVFSIVILGYMGFSILWTGIISALIIFLPPLLTYIVFLSMPASKAKKRGRGIDAKISGSMSFISAMASADVPVDTIFKEVSRQPIYGEIREEAKWVTRDTELLGVDILTAIRDAARRCPSTKLQDFLQGVVTTSTSGGQLKPYFLAKAEQFEKENKLDTRKKMETLGMLAESFVTVVVAFPLFLVVILAIMSIVGGNPQFTLNILYAIVLMMIPLSQFMFIFVIWNMSQEA